ESSSWSRMSKPRWRLFAGPIPLATRALGPCSHGARPAGAVASARHGVTRIFRVRIVGEGMDAVLALGCAWWMSHQSSRAPDPAPQDLSGTQVGQILTVLVVSIAISCVVVRWVLPFCPGTA